MCLIFQKPGNVDMTQELIRKAYGSNRDGFGLMYSDAEQDGKVVVIKTMGGADEILEIYEQHKHRDLGIHFRYATHGAKNLENCHPFRVLNKAEHGRDLWMMHNGVITQVPTEGDKSKSDSWHYARNWLKPLLEHNPELLQQPGFQQFLGVSIGLTGNKLLFLDDLNRFTIINPQLWEQHKLGFWVSSHFFDQTKTYSSTTTRGVSHHTWNGYGIPKEKVDRGKALDFWESPKNNKEEDFKEKKTSNVNVTIRDDSVGVIEDGEILEIELLERLTYSDLFDVAVAMPEEITDLLWAQMHGRDVDDFNEDEGEDESAQTEASNSEDAATEAA